MNDLKKRLDLLLDALPKSADEIAKYLKEAGVKGSKMSTANCPLANHFSARGVRVSVGSSILDNSTGAVLEKSPSYVIDFISKFDNGEYPDLVDDRTQNALSFYPPKWYSYQMIRQGESVD